MLTSDYLKRMSQKEAEYYRSYNSLERQVQETLKKKVFLSISLNNFIES